MRESLTCTQKKAYWVLLPSIKDVPYAPIKDINFVGKSWALNAWKGSHHLPSPLKLPSSISSSSSTLSSSLSSPNVSPTLCNSPLPSSPSPLTEHSCFQFPPPSPNTTQVAAPIHSALLEHNYNQLPSPPNSPLTCSIK